MNGVKKQMVICQRDITINTYRKTKVVHCKKSPYDIYIGRPGKWGNPFEIGKDGDRKTVIAKYRDYISNSPLLADIEELRGKRLGCWCKPAKCHGDVLVELLGE